MFDHVFIQALGDWFINHGITILIVLIGAWFGRGILNKAIERGVRQFITEGDDGTKESEEKRENTLIQVLQGIVNILVWIVAGMIVLSELGIAVGPLIAAAGVAGLAIGFGGQYIIRDVITGLLLILENQYRVGDVVCFEGLCGKVENITIRKTTIRDIDGAVHHIPHGGVNRVSNRTRSFARVNMIVGVSYSADIDQVAQVVDEVGAELAADPAWKSKIQSTPKFIRIDDFGDSSVNIRIMGDTQPGMQWEVAGEFRYRLKKAFDAAHIEIPFPQRVIHAPAPEKKPRAKKK